MIHGEHKGQLYSQAQAYDAHGRVQRAIDRGALNKRLLDVLAAMPNVKFFFHHKLVGADFRKNKAWFERRTPHGNSETSQAHDEAEVDFDFMIGADGAHSAVRYHLMKFARLNYQQEYIDTLWCEFQIPPSVTGGFRISPNHFHIWPAGSHMFLAIPNLDTSFTCTLFLQAEKFEQLDQDPRSVIPFFQKNYPGIIPDLITEEDAVRQYKENPHLPLISIKCTPYHFGSSVVIVGDAAHAMVPFYGQGMNTGMEDVRVLFEILDQYSATASQTGTPASSSKGDSSAQARSTALAAYSAQRHPDTAAINDLAIRNYQEMRADVRSRWYLFRKHVEEWLSLYVPRLGWATQYARVSFGNMRYSEVETRAKWQGMVLWRVVMMSGLTMGGLAGWWMGRNQFWRRIGGNIRPRWS
ncbi:FAD/NAD(P)-binding domain-containing protein [Eremomyces bilateralis CBS 781.70]|uniref:FAD/NAD(P)-binding domain-containing protein n=1 Tax=Eremomyces bilateralis CBS 781.70 TaxID=1392243 RepID=A0A6G1GGZ6_9PEZI|nr:FAD/NAD(P)-binding domain-containing protein [Eremomyces bilateralis CBS 781.70]KAF1817323.1 FAD/NAD(P)-binding domain-containing protein [Eremomyces bilateralis CBS 781.70]